MKHILQRIVVLGSLLIACAAASAQEPITEEQIYSNVSSYVADNEPATPTLKASKTVRRKNIQDIRWQHDIRIGIGSTNIMTMAMFDSPIFADCDIEPRSYTLSENLYRYRQYHGPARMISAISAEYGYTLKPWLKMGAKFSYMGSWQTRYDGLSNERTGSRKTNIFALLCNVRFDWLRRKSISLYSSIGVGMAARAELNNNAIFPMCDCTFVGMSVGRSFYGFVELGGGIGGWARVGVGVNFNVCSKK